MIRLKHVDQKRLAKKLAPNSITYSKLQSATYQTWWSNGATEKIYGASFESLVNAV